MKTYLVTGGSGSFGSAVTQRLLDDGHKVRALARGEHKLDDLERSIPAHHRPHLSILVGDVRDRYRLWRALEGVDVVIHAAALKGVPRCEYDPTECVKTNIEGTQAVIDACLDMNVKRAVFISTDKAAAPVTLYGYSKATAERLWLNANRYCGSKEGVFIASRWGNVFGSAGSVLGAWKEQEKTGKLKITNTASTRFYLRMEGAVNFVLKTLLEAQPGQLFVPKLPSYLVQDLALAFNPNLPHEVIGLRGGEKVHEAMISRDESCCAVDAGDHFILTPGVVTGLSNWEYTSGTNQHRLSIEKLKGEIEWFNGLSSLPKQDQRGALATTT